MADNVDGVCYTCGKGLSPYCEEHDLTAVKRPMLYDISIDERRPVTQQDWDAQEQRLRQLLSKSWAELPVGSSVDPATFTFELALFANPMRLGQYFVAENREIEPFTGADGRAIIDWQTQQPYYPPIPATPWHIRGDLPKGFASELVRRWNRCAELEQELEKLKDSQS